MQVSIKERQLLLVMVNNWMQINGHTLHDRYGMTEIGMAISNPLHGERRAGYIGKPLPGVQVQLVDDTFQQVAIDEPGEILIKGDNVFLEYWNNCQEMLRKK